MISSKAGIGGGLWVFRVGGTGASGLGLSVKDSISRLQELSAVRPQ